MAEALRQYWYLGIALIAAVILTLWVIKKAAQASSRAHAEREAHTRDVLAGGTNVLYAPKQSADGTETAVTSRAGLDKTCTLTPKLFFQAAAQLGAMNADPIGDSYIAR